jgi:hypothetical protein
MAGLFALECAIHRARETAAHLGIFAHPFHQVTGGDGRFGFHGVPRSARALSAFDPDRGPPVEIALPEAAGRVTIRLP